ncbi:hypothetical protein NYO67_4673 [Aspergillus flavus]|nr:hypothetical protein NYO67_4673 [Aspergillus flavus]
MPHKVNQSNSTLASTGSSGDRVVVTDLRDVPRSAPRGPTQVHAERNLPSSFITRGDKYMTKQDHPIGTSSGGSKHERCQRLGLRSPAAGQRM